MKTIPGLPRREFLVKASALGYVALGSTTSAQEGITTEASFGNLPPYGNNTLPAGVRPRLVRNVNGLTVNMLEAGTQGRPLVLLIHGFPNLAYSWRKVMPALAAAGYYVVAPDCRGFGRTVGWDNSWDADPGPFLILNMVRDQIALLYALGYRKAEMVVGHDQGQPVAVYAAIIPAGHVFTSHNGRRGRRRPTVIPICGRGEETVVHQYRARRRVGTRLDPPREGISGLLGEPAGR